MGASFELLLVPRGDYPIDRQALWHGVAIHPHVQAERGVPGKFTYYNRSTTVHFSISMGEDVDPDAEADGGFAGALPAHVDVLSDASTGSRTSRRDEEDLTEEEEEEENEDEDDDEQDEEDEEDEPHIELPPVSVHIPLFRPSFFLTEALEFLRRLKSATDLRLAMPAAATGDDTREDVEEEDPTSATSDQVVRRWREAHRDVFSDVADKEYVEVWPAERCAAFYDYNRRLAEIAEDLALDGIDVAPIQPARHEGRIKTLCVWSCDRPAVLPRTDLVLVRRPRPGGLFRRAGVDEFLVPGETIWKLLEGFSQSRYDPAPMLIVRSAEEAPGQLRAELEALAGEPTANARRTELAGVVDFELG